VLRETAETGMRAALRAETSFARLGGDEFVALLTDTTWTMRWRREAPARRTPSLGVFSAGLAPWNRREPLRRCWRADIALYAAKMGGGDGVEVGPPQRTLTARPRRRARCSKRMFRPFEIRSN